MFKYPLAVTIDTNIFDAAKFDLSDNSTLRILENYVKNGKIKVVLSDIVVRESKRHIADQVKGICRIMRSARSEALSMSTEHLISSVGLNDMSRIVKNKNELISKGEEMFDDFLRTINAEILGADLIDVDSILSDYFETRPPFEESEKKKSEFPDAFIAQQIRKRFGETEKVVIVSNDKGFVRACQESENHLFFNSLGDLYNAINKEEKVAYDKTISVIKEVQLRISVAVREYIKDNENIDVRGLSYDKDGIKSGYDYNEFYLYDISEVTFKVHSVDELSENSSIVTLLCKADISADCYYKDYVNAPWDSEEKEYVFIDTMKIREKHRAYFGCRIEIDREAKTFKIFPFTVILGGDSRIDRYKIEKNSTEDNEEIRDMDRKALGFQTLGSYKSYLDNALPESPFYATVISKFEKINNLYRKYEDCCISFDELLEKLNAVDSKETVKLLYEKLVDASDIPCINNIENITDFEIEKIRMWAKTQYEKASEIVDVDILPDIITFGDTITIRGVDGSEAVLSIGDNQIEAEVGSEEIIDICFSDGNKNTVSGYIKLMVGYLNFDEDGGVADGISDEIEYEYYNVLEELDKFIGVQNCMVQKDIQIAEIIRETIKAGLNNA